MNTIKELFDSSKDINRRIESVVTFADNSEENLKNEINEYVVTDKLHDNYEKVIEELESAFRDSSNEVGVWVSDSMAQVRVHLPNIWDIHSSSH